MAASTQSSLLARSLRDEFLGADINVDEVANNVVIEAQAQDVGVGGMHDIFNKATVETPIQEMPTVSLKPKHSVKI